MRQVANTKDAFLETEEAATYKVVVARTHDSEADAEEAVPPMDAAIVMQGWLMEADARGGRALHRPQNRYVVLEGGGGLSWYEDAERERQVGAQVLVGVRCSMLGAGSSANLPARTGKVCTPASSAELCTAT